MAVFQLAGKLGGAGSLSCERRRVKSAELVVGAHNYSQSFCAPTGKRGAAGLARSGSAIGRVVGGQLWEFWVVKELANGLLRKPAAGMFAVVG